MQLLWRIIAHCSLLIAHCSLLIAHCSLLNAESEAVERRTRIDIVFEKTIEHFDAEIKHCTACDTTTRGQFPSDIHGKLQYGNGLKAFIVHLMISQMVTVNRVQKMITAMIGTKLSESTLLSYILRLHVALEPWELAVKEKLLACMLMRPR